MKLSQYKLLYAASTLISVIASEGSNLNHGLASQTFQAELQNTDVSAANDAPDYACTKTKKCKLGCCGPLSVCRERHQFSPEGWTDTFSPEIPRAMASAAWDRSSAVKVVHQPAIKRASVILAGARAGLRQTSVR